ncbi:MAG: NAD-dependent deacylase [Terriglobales bacterium]
MRMIEISSTDRVFVLTGAGISAESGIPTFRDAHGLWGRFRPEEVATPEAWRADPQLVWDFYSERRRNAHGRKPNPGHETLAKLEKTLGDRILICTQNVDSLHEQAGSTRVIHMHGELFKSRCEVCSRPPFSDDRTYTGELPRCDCGGKIRPHVCWFGEMPFQMDEIFQALESCTVFLTIGSSGLVEPAASFPLWAGRENSCGKARTYYIGVEEPANSTYFDQVFIGKAGELLPKLFLVAAA